MTRTSSTAAPGRALPHRAVSRAEQADDRQEVARVVDAWQRGIDREANFRWLAERFYRPLLAFFVRRGTSTADAHDLTQETFVCIYRGLKGYHHGASFATWLFSVASNVYLKTLRDRHALKRRAELSAEAIDDVVGEIAAGSPSPLDNALGGQQRQLLRAALEQLPRQMRACLEMQVYQELSYRDIADVLDLSTETVKSHLKSGRKRLVALLAPEHHDDQLPAAVGGNR